MRSHLAFTVLSLLILAGSTRAFSIVPPSSSVRSSIWTTRPALSSQPVRESTTQLYMSDKERSRTTKKGVQTLIKEKTEEKEDEKKDPQYRVLLHNDEVHTFQYVVRALTKCIGTLDRAAAFEICVETHGRGKAIITKTWKKQAQQFCMGLQRQGLTVSITPDEDIDGGHYGGGNV
mmetsp:Transcript_17489/g.25856  ORF Transcript_17489/g.25856 Transcript_17489/m.25856 type:complete len:176 (+) Transcript_17489:124-651(+)|eukprot:CAMPEP_0194198970 /NCGR_PEP_ID=MMETSP0156-20130528/170_1 /TAXON_ID=33649 /ORGANISM="Thalassionema nitzschioides, Strain L26-B" /LENGTH=175 /DNA_ID=CAMNT_0038923803 /DNA_START=75 /DNA_END=602 /DNA_ORIENTATION=+